MGSAAEPFHLPRLGRRILQPALQYCEDVWRVPRPMTCPLSRPLQLSYAHTHRDVPTEQPARMAEARDRWKRARVVLDSTDRLALVLSVRPCCSESKLPNPSNYSNEECHVCSCAEGNSSLRVPGDLKHGDRSEASPVPCAACIYALHICVYVCRLVRGQHGRDRGQCISILGAANKVTDSKQEPVPTHEYSLRACGCGWVAPFATSPCVSVIGASAWGSRGRSG